MRHLQEGKNDNFPSVGILQDLSVAFKSLESFENSSLRSCLNDVTVCLPSF